jgi:transposase-like protein
VPDGQGTERGRRRPRRRFADGFKAQAVGLVLDEGQAEGAVASDRVRTETSRSTTGVRWSSCCT